MQEGARFGDVLEIRTTPEVLSKYRLNFDHQVWKEGTPKALVLGKVEMVCLDRAGKLVPLPELVIEGYVQRPCAGSRTDARAG